MAGTFGYELDLTQMNDEDKEAVKIQIEQYKKYADIIIPRGGENKIGIHILQEHLKLMLD